jgi:DNA-binding response OmpR family regulator
MDPKTILIVEDEIPLLKALSQKLKQEGFNVLEATDGIEGLNSAITYHPDLILSDIVMPNMDGLTMLQKLREDAWGQTAQIILLTNLNDTKDVDMAVQNSVFDFLVKNDWKLKDVVDKIKLKLNIPITN